MDIINQDSDFTLPLTFSELPTSCSYKVLDAATGRTIVAETTFSVSTVTHDLDVPRTATAMINSSLMEESRRMVFKWVYGAAKQGTSEYLFSVKRIQGI